MELVLGLLDNLLEALQGLFLLDVFCARLVLQLAVVLDLLARVLDLGQTERGGRALEEVAQLAERLKLLLLATRQSAVHRSNAGGGTGQNAQVGVHLDKGALSLGEEVVDDAFGELALGLVLVHLEDLLKGRGVDGVLSAGNRHDALAAVDALCRLEGVREGCPTQGGQKQSEGVMMVLGVQEMRL